MCAFPWGSSNRKAKFCWKRRCFLCFESLSWYLADGLTILELGFNWKFVKSIWGLFFIGMKFLPQRIQAFLLGFLKPVPVWGVSFKHDTIQFLDTSRVSDNSTLFWHCLHRDNIRFCCLRVQSYRVAPIPNLRCMWYASGCCCCPSDQLAAD